MNLAQSLAFLEELDRHNTKEWMDDHKAWYQECRQEFIEYTQAMITGVSRFAPEVSGLDPRKCIFRINRDVRFSKDKSPYKTNFGAALSEGGKKSDNPAYYLHLQPGEVFVGGGIYMPPAEVLAKIRQEVDYNPEELKRIVEKEGFRKVFGEIRGEKLKTAPKGYPKDHPNIEFLKLKSFTVFTEVPDEAMVKDDSLSRVLGHFETMKPFIDYLSVAVS